MDVVFKKAFGISRCVDRLPETGIRKGDTYTVRASSDARAARVASTNLRLVPFTLDRVAVDVSVVRVLQKDVVDFTKMIRFVLRSASLETTAYMTWPILFPGFDGITDGSLVMLF
jgi:hypothetical protein